MDDTGVHHGSTKILIGILVVIVLLSAVLAALLFFSRALPPSTENKLATIQQDQAAFTSSQYQDATGAHASLKSGNDDFANAMKLYNAGKFTEALPLYEKALAATSDVSQQTVIEFWIASTEESTHDFSSAIAIYKGLAAASTTLSQMTRAYAVQDLGHMFYRYGDSAITGELFKDEPYKSMRTSSVSASYRNVFEYAISLYPLALSELYSANWYANALIAAPTTHPEYKELIRTRLALAAQDIAQLRSQPAYLQTYLQSLEEEGIVLGKMHRLGDVTFADPEPVFQEALSVYQAQHVSGDATVRYQYAAYLARAFGASRATDITSLLAPVIANPAAHGKAFTTFLRNERANALGSKANLVLLSSLDPDLKTLLLSLGWQESDFGNK